MAPGYKTPRCASALHTGACRRPLRLITRLPAVEFADPGMQRVDVHTQLPSDLSDRLIRLHHQSDRNFFKFSCIGITLFLTHETHLDRQVILPASVCPGNYSQIIVLPFLYAALLNFDEKY